MKLKTVRLEDVRPYENNPRQNDGAVDAVAERSKARTRIEREKSAS